MHFSSLEPRRDGADDSDNGGWDNRGAIERTEGPGGGAIRGL